MSETTIPEELKRQSGRIDTQVINLGKILDTVNSNLQTVNDMMTKYNPELCNQVIKLKTALEDYKGRATTIYSELSESLMNYAINLSTNITELSSGIDSIAAMINNL